MELLLISERRLKVTLSAEDMEKYSLTAETMDYENTETRRAFWSILDEAKHRTGFDAASERIFVQVYPSRCGGCEMFVTKLGEGRASEERLWARENERKKSTAPDSPSPSALPAGASAPMPCVESLSGAGLPVRAERPGPPARHPLWSGSERLCACKGAYCFENMTQLLRACRSLAGMGAKEAAMLESSAYEGDDGRCYLLLTGVCLETPGRNLLSPVGKYESFAVAGEYGRALGGERLRKLGMYIAEHCRPLREGDAVAALSRLA